MKTRGGCLYTRCQWDKHKRLALSAVWARAWGLTPALNAVCPSVPSSSPFPWTQTPLQCNTRVSLSPPLENCNGSTLQNDPSPRHVQLNPVLAAAHLQECRTVLRISVQPDTQFGPARRHVLTQRCGYPLQKNP